MPEDLDTNDDDPPQAESPVITNLRKDREDAIAEAAAAKRELTLHRAGLGDLDPMKMKALAAAHEGDWVPEGLKETATKLGFVQTEGSQPAEPKVPDAELDAMQRVANASGAPPPPPPDLEAAIAAAETEEELKKVLHNAGLLEPAE